MAGPCQGRGRSCYEERAQSTSTVSLNGENTHTQTPEGRTARPATRMGYPGERLEIRRDRFPFHISCDLEFFSSPNGHALLLRIRREKGNGADGAEGVRDTDQSMGYKRGEGEAPCNGQAEPVR